MPAKPNHYRGITLLEVLISMGILTIGLVSVVSLLPAGRSMAVKASVYDRSTTLAANAAADLINRGLLRSEKWANYANAPNNQKPAQRLVVLDPLVERWFPPDWLVMLRGDAAAGGQSSSVFMQPLTGLVMAPIPGPVMDIVFRSEDDPVYSIDLVGADDPPVPKWSAPPGTPARRSFQGTYSYLATLQSASPLPPFWEPGTPATLTVVVFHRRDPNLQPISLTADDQTAAKGWPISLDKNQRLKDVAKPGTMALLVDNTAKPPAFRWHRVLMATEAESGSRASFTCEGADPLATKDNVLFVFPGSVAAAEMPVRLEGASRWNH